ncbi:MAG: hypothetical protein WC548_02960 [Candidatus Pacearchaeota archaeon]
MKKKAQESIGMSFGVIFAIFLIIIFLLVAFFTIKHFLDIEKTSKVGLFYRDFQESVDSAFISQSTEFNFEINLPPKIEKICFANLSAKITGNQADYKELENYDIYEANVFLIPSQFAESMEYKLINHLNITKIIENKNPYCIPVSQNILIKKDFYDRLVSVE